MIELKLAETQAGASCLTCGQSISVPDETRQCLQCGASHHPMCWDARGGCNHQPPPAPAIQPSTAASPILQSQARTAAQTARLFGVLSLLAVVVGGVLLGSSDDLYQLGRLILRFAPTILGGIALRNSTLVGRTAGNFAIDPAVKRTASAGGVMGAIGCVVSVVTWLTTL